MVFVGTGRGESIKVSSKVFGVASHAADHVIEIFDGFTRPGIGLSPVGRFSLPRWSAIDEISFKSCSTAPGGTSLRQVHLSDCKLMTLGAGVGLGFSMFSLVCRRRASEILKADAGGLEVGGFGVSAASMVGKVFIIPQ